MFACDGRVTTVDACAAVNRTPPAARRSIHGVATLLLPYAPTASARSVSIVIRRTFCDASRRTRVAFDEVVHAITNDTEHTKDTKDTKDGKDSAPRNPAQGRPFVSSVSLVSLVCLEITS